MHWPGCARMACSLNVNTLNEWYPWLTWTEIYVRQGHDGLVHVRVDRQFESLPLLRRERVVVDLGVKKQRQAVLFAQLDAWLDRVGVVHHQCLERKLQERPLLLILSKTNKD